MKLYEYEPITNLGAKLAAGEGKTRAVKAIGKRLASKMTPAPSFDSSLAAQNANRVSAVTSSASKGKVVSGSTKAVAGKAAKIGLSAGAKKALLAGGLAGAHIASTAAVAKSNLEAPEKKIEKLSNKEGNINLKTKKKWAKIDASKGSDEKKSYLKAKAGYKADKEKAISKSKQKYYRHYVDEPKNEEIVSLRNFIIENSDILSDSLEERISRGAKGATIGMALGSAPGAVIGHAIGKAVEKPEDKKVRATHEFEKKAASLNYKKNLADLKNKNTGKYDWKLRNAKVKLGAKKAKLDFAQQKLNAKNQMKANVKAAKASF